jgi:hypothetical protein
MESSKPSRQVLEATPAKALTFLRALGTLVDVRALLASAGYTDADQLEGWTGLHAASGFNPTKPAGVNVDKTARDAIVQLDAWDEGGFRRSRAALGRLHPEQCEFVFENLEPAQGPEAILGVAEFLKRLDLLEAGRSDKTREADAAAINTLAVRGIDKKERTRLADLVKAAQAGCGNVTAGDAAKANEEELLALHAWYSDWADTARAVVRKRSHLISLGLAHRRSRKDEENEPGVETEIAQVS